MTVSFAAEVALRESLDDRPGELIQDRVAPTPPSACRP